MSRSSDLLDIPLTQALVPEVAIRDLFTYKTQSTRETRVSFSGVVVAVNAPDWIAVQDMESGILLQPAPLAGVEIGDRVRVPPGKCGGSSPRAVYRATLR